MIVSEYEHINGFPTGIEELFEDPHKSEGPPQAIAKKQNTSGDYT
jgi:hypothetical protein